MSQPIKYLPGRGEDLSSIPRAHIRKSDVGTRVRSQCGEAESWDLLTSRLVSLVSAKMGGTLGMAPKDVIWLLHSFEHTHTHTRMHVHTYSSTHMYPAHIQA